MSMSSTVTPKRNATCYIPCPDSDSCWSHKNRLNIALLEWMLRRISQPSNRHLARYGAYRWASRRQQTLMVSYFLLPTSTHWKGPLNKKPPLKRYSFLLRWTLVLSNNPNIGRFITCRPTWELPAASAQVNHVRRNKRKVFPLLLTHYITNPASVERCMAFAKA